MNIGNVLKEIRVSKKMTQIQVSKRIKISQTAISQIESNNKNPHPSTLKSFCKLYGIPPQIIIWKSLTESDIDKNKRDIFKRVKPEIDKLILQFIK